MKAQQKIKTKIEAGIVRATDRLYRRLPCGTMRRISPKGMSFARIDLALAKPSFNNLSVKGMPYQAPVTTTKLYKTK